MKKILLYSFFLLLTGACNKKDKGWENEAYPIVSIFTPSDNQIFSAGQTAQITGLITDSHKGLTQIQIHIYNNATGQLLIDMISPPDLGESHYLNQPLQLQAGTQYKIQVVAINKLGKQGTGTVLISVN